MNKKLKTFCPLPFNHLSANPSGIGRVCCEGFEELRDDLGRKALWKSSSNLYYYLNTKDYKKIRRQMLNGERPRHCRHCFNQEDYGVKSMRLQFMDSYRSDIQQMINNTNEDGSIKKPQISYIDMPLGNKCNLKCRMCSPGVSYLIAKDWKKMYDNYNLNIAKKIFQDKWFTDSNTLQMIREALPYTKVLFTAGGEPMIIKEHLKILEMIIEEGHAHHILLRYNSNQTVIPKQIIELWKHFQKVVFNCSIEAPGNLNDYIRYPSQWKKLEKNIHFLDELADERKNMELYIHTTLQAYNVMRIPDLLNYLSEVNFKNITRFPFFILVKFPEWLAPSILPKKIRHEIVYKILKSLDKHEKFFCSYNNGIHRQWSIERIKVLKSFCEMIKNDNSSEKYFERFIKETKAHDKIRNQSILDVLPELKTFF